MNRKFSIMMENLNLKIVPEKVTQSVNSFVIIPNCY